jgi:hypothetical protein
MLGCGPEWAVSWGMYVSAMQAAGISAGGQTLIPFVLSCVTTLVLILYREEVYIRCERMVKPAM